MTSKEIFSLPTYLFTVQTTTTFFQMIRIYFIRKPIAFGIKIQKNQNFEIDIDRKIRLNAVTPIKFFSFGYNKSQSMSNNMWEAF